MSGSKETTRVRKSKPPVSQSSGPSLNPTLRLGQGANAHQRDTGAVPKGLSGHVTDLKHLLLGRDETATVTPILVQQPPSTTLKKATGSP